MLLKCRITCVVLAVVCLAGLGITLFAVQTPNMPLAYFFAYTCIAALAANAVISVVELKQAGKRLQEKIEEERLAAEKARRNAKKRKANDETASADCL